MTITKITLYTSVEKKEALQQYVKHFFIFEQYIYKLADQLFENYQGGIWNVHVLSNHTVFFSLETNTEINVVSFNGHTEKLSTEDAGLFITLMAYNHLSFQFEEFHSHYLKLNEFLSEKDDDIHSKILLLLD